MKAMKESANAKPYRTYKRGLNLEIMCEYEDCAVYKDKARAIVHFGYDHFDIVKKFYDLKCPVCHEFDVKIYSPGYCLANVTIRSRKKNSSLIEVVKFQVGNKYAIHRVNSED